MRQATRGLLLRISIPNLVREGGTTSREKEIFTFWGELGNLSFVQAGPDGWKETILISKTEGQSSIGQMHSNKNALS